MSTIPNKLHFFRPKFGIGRDKTLQQFRVKRVYDNSKFSDLHILKESHKGIMKKGLHKLSCSTIKLFEQGLGALTHVKASMRKLQILVFHEDDEENERKNTLKVLTAGKHLQSLEVPWKTYSALVSIGSLRGLTQLTLMISQFLHEPKAPFHLDKYFPHLKALTLNLVEEGNGNELQDLDLPNIMGFFDSFQRLKNLQYIELRISLPYATEQMLYFLQDHVFSKVQNIPISKIHLGQKESFSINFSRCQAFFSPIDFLSVQHEKHCGLPAPWLQSPCSKGFEVACKKIDLPCLLQLCPSLRVLRLHLSIIADLQEDFIPSLNIHTLEIFDPARHENILLQHPNIISKIQALLQQTKNLVKLVLPTFEISLFSISELTDLYELPCLKTLEEHAVSMKNPTYFGWWGWQAVAEGIADECPPLDDLKMSLCRFKATRKVRFCFAGVQSFSFLEHVLARYSNLKYLKLQLEQNSEVELKIPFAAFPELTHFSLDVGALTKESERILLKDLCSLKSLKSLDLRGDFSFLMEGEQNYWIQYFRRAKGLNFNVRSF